MRFGSYVAAVAIASLVALFSLGCSAQSAGGCVARATPAPPASDAEPDRSMPAGAPDAATERQETRIALGRRVDDIVEGAVRLTEELERLRALRGR